jgi:cysteinyl-tRNA synthetase
VTQRSGSVAPATVPAEFSAAMDDDLSTPQAIAVVHHVVREGNVALDRGDDRAARDAAASVRTMTGILGLDPLSPKWMEDTRADDAARVALTTLVDGILQQRETARADRDFATADQLRNRLLAAGIAVEDTPDGPQWTLKDG